MAVTGVLSEFSLPEIFQFLDHGNKTGLLTIKSFSTPANRKETIHHIWFQIGRVVAAADRVDGQGLPSMIHQRNWLSDRVASKLSLICADSPLGLCLKSQGLLQAEQLKMLFYGQVIRQVCALFKVENGRFIFESQVKPNTMEMTGLSLPGTEVTLMGLRALKDWTALTDKLPDPSSTLLGLGSGKPNLRLDAQEWQIWEFVNGNLPLKKVAEQLSLSIEKVQQIAFRLIVVNLAEELPMFDQVASSVEPIGEPIQPSQVVEPASERSQVSQSFLQNLVGFLRTKA